MSWAEILPVIFMGLMGLAMFLYVVLDGFDLGVGMLLHRADDGQKDMMIASIGPCPLLRERTTVAVHCPV